jgi:hypothetical protein
VKLNKVRHQPGSVPFGEISVPVPTPDKRRDG